MRLGIVACAALLAACLVAFLVSAPPAATPVIAARAAAQANATKGWHRCQPISGYGRAALCNGQGHVLFPWILDRESQSGGYTQVVTGFRQTSSRRAIVDTHADWGSIQGECGQNGVIRDCKDWVADEQIRYRTSDGGRHWRPVSFHRKVTRYEGPGPEPPVQTGSVDDHPPLQPCNWSHADRHVLARGLGPRFGNWCAPPDEWTMPDSLTPGAR
jgi:hypothetical protein